MSVTENTRGGVDNVIRGSNFTSHTEVCSRLDPCDIAYLGDDPIGYKCVRDTGSWVNLIKSSLVPDGNLTGESVLIQFANGATEKCPTEIMTIKSRFYSGDVEAALLESPSFDVILGNTPRVNTLFKSQHAPDNATVEISAGKVINGRDFICLSAGHF